MSIGKIADNGNKGSDFSYRYGMLRDKRCVGYEKITVADSVLGFTVPEGSTYALVSVECAGEDGIRCRFDGGDATVIDGHLFKDGGTFDVFNRINLVKFRCIGATGGVLHVSYYI